ncbi:hypothetical protein Y032_0083g1625 [Ancylostoma ceylanicum]|uniref:Uncharacterized protein n=1 Tax=Ancylostoma ceylanicum TaxID=53326 RepID=A0A016TRX9_9BILA|nr:hypothetical protein Y032_0083g1625 [Ancylostoma ceylanicum]
MQKRVPFLGFEKLRDNKLRSFLYNWSVFLLFNINVMNNYQENRDSPLRRRSNRERRGRVACFSRPRQGHPHRRPL